MINRGHKVCSPEKYGDRDSKNFSLLFELLLIFLLTINSTFAADCDCDDICVCNNKEEIPLANSFHKSWGYDSRTGEIKTGKWVNHNTFYDEKSEDLDIGDENIIFDTIEKGDE